MICTVEHRSDQLRKAGVAAGDQTAAVALERVHLREQISRFGHHVLAGLETHRELFAALFAELTEAAGDLRPHRHVVDPFLIRAVGHLEAAAEIEELKIGEVRLRGDPHQIFHALIDRFRMLKSAAGVLVQTDNPELPFADDLQHLVDRLQQNAEFGQIAAGHGLLAVAVADIRIEAQTEIEPGMALRQLAQPGERADVHHHAGGEHLFDLGIGHVVGRIDDLLRGEAELEGEMDFPGADGVQPGSGVAQQREKSRVVVRFQSVVNAETLPRNETEEIVVTLHDHVSVVDEERGAVLCRQFQEQFTFQHDLPPQ